MLKKLSGLSRSIYIVLAIIAGFVAMGGVNVALILVALGLLAGLAMPDERMVPATVTALALPMIGDALGHIPTVGEHLVSVAGNLQLGVAGALGSALSIRLYHLVMEGVTKMGGDK